MACRTSGRMSPCVQSPPAVTCISSLLLTASRSHCTEDHTCHVTMSAHPHNLDLMLRCQPFSADRQCSKSLCHQQPALCFHFAVASCGALQGIHAGGKRQAHIATCPTSTSKSPQYNRPGDCRDAKLSVLEWDDAADRFATSSLHYFEGDAVLRGGRRVFARGPKAVTDPQVPTVVCGL